MIMIIHLLSFAHFLCFYTHALFLSLDFALFDVVMNWEVRLDSIELIYLEKLFFCISNRTSENSKQV